MNLGENKKYVKAGITGIVIAIAACLCLFFLYHIDGVRATWELVFSILRPFLYGAVLAYLLTPVCGKLQAGLEKVLGEKRKRFCKGIAILASILLALFLVGLLFFIVVPQVVRNVVSIVRALPGQLINLNSQIDELLVDQPDLQEQWRGVSRQIVAEVEAWRNQDLLPLVQSPLAQSILTGTATYLTTLLVFIKDVLLGLVISIYLLATRKQFAAQCKLLLRSVFTDWWADRIEGEMHYVDRMFNGFLTGKVLDSLIVGLLCFLGCVCMGFSSAPLISVIVGVTNIIPFFGPFIGAVPCALLLLLSNPLHCLMFVLFILVLQQLDGNVIGPKVLGNTTGLSGFWVTFAILLFGGLWGITGMIVGVPLFAVIYDVVRRLCYRSLNRKGRQNMIQAYKAQFHPAETPKEPEKPKKEEANEQK